MAAYKYPRSVEFVDALPKSASGKILWRELEEAARAGGTGGSTVGSPLKGERSPA